MSFFLKTLLSTDSLVQLTLFTVTVLLFLLWKRKRIYFLASKYPGPPSYPIIGNMLDFSDRKAIISSTIEMMKKHGPFFKIWIGPSFGLALGKPEYLQTVLNNTNCMRKCLRVYNGTTEFISTGLIVAEPEIWKAHRKLLNPAFNQKILDNYVAIFQEQSEIFVKVLQQKVGAGIFDVSKLSEKCTLDVVCETTMNTQVKAQSTPSQFFETMEKIFQLLTERIFRVWLHPDFIWENSWRGKELKRNIHVTHQYTNMIIKMASENRTASKTSNNVNEDESFDIIKGNKRRSLLDILLDAKEENKLTHLEILHEISTFVNAGTDTSSLAISYFMLCMAFYPEILKKVQNELDEIFGQSDREVSVDDLPKLEYLERAIKETMRLYPPVAFTARRAEKEIYLENDYTIPKDSTVFIGHILAHYNSEQWPDPYKFDPDRFLPEEIAKRHPYSYIPFSAGPRNCIGFKYAMMLLKVVLANVFRKFVPKTNLKPEDIVLKLDIVVRPIQGHMIYLENR